jgi:GR25 family glycosyltransferase involved in LPS biosynthesis
MDRKINTITRSRDIGINVEVVSAISASEIEEATEKPYALPAIVALWESHRKVWSLFLESEEEICLVLEDDVIFLGGAAKLLLSANVFHSGHFDLLQIGFLGLSTRWNFRYEESFHHFRIRIYRRVIEVLDLNPFFNLIQNFIPRIDSVINQRRKKIAHERAIEDTLENLFLCIPEFRSGTHAYLLTRSGAQKLMQFNLPVLFGSDLALQMLAISKSLRIFRLNTSVAGQDDTLVSIGEHYRCQKNLARVLKENS